MSSSSACKNLNQMATRVFMLLLVTSVGFLFFNMKTFQHGVVDWRSWTTLDVLKTDSVQEWGCSQLSSIFRGLLLSMQRATGYLLTATSYITSVFTRVIFRIQSTARTFSRSGIQFHTDNGAPHKANFTWSYLDHNSMHLMELSPYSPDTARVSIAHSKNQIIYYLEDLFKNQHLAKSCPFRDECHTCLRVRAMLLEVGDV